MPDEKRGAGRPKTRGNEAAMFVLWRMVQIEIHVHGAKGVSEACRRMAARSIRFDWGDTKRENDELDNVKTLHRRYYAAEDARKDAIMYPVLHARCEQFLQDLPALGIRSKAMADYVKSLKMKGYDPGAVTGIGAVPDEFLSLHSLVLLVAKKSVDP
jgi:hypothetical protein